MKSSGTRIISRVLRNNFNKQNKFGEHYFNLPFKYMDEVLNKKQEVI